jgi:hypothetical protein
MMRDGKLIETYEHAGDFKEPRTRNGWRSSQRTSPKPSEVTVTAPRPGRAHKISGVILIVAGAAWEFLEEVFQWMPQSHNAGWQLLRIDPLSRLMILGGAFLFWRGRQYAAKANAERILTDSDPHVLYLRAFRSDTSIKGYLFSSIPRAGVSGITTQEEQLAEVLRPFGDLVAIGRPGEQLPTPGAARIYASDAGWKESSSVRCG